MIHHCRNYPNYLLASGAVTPGRTDIAGLSALRLCIVILLGKGDDAGLVVSEKFYELVDVLRCDSGLITSAVTPSAKPSTSPDTLWAVASPTREARMVEADFIV